MIISILHWMEILLWVQMFRSLALSSVCLSFFVFIFSFFVLRIHFYFPVYLFFSLSQFFSLALHPNRFYISIMQSFFFLVFLFSFTIFGNFIYFFLFSAHSFIHRLHHCRSIFPFLHLLYLPFSLNLSFCHSISLSLPLYLTLTPGRNSSHDFFTQLKQSSFQLVN